MSKKTSYLLGILLTIIIGTFFYWKLCCKCNEKSNKKIVVPKVNKTRLAPFGIKEVNNELLSKMKGLFNFGKSNYIIKDSLPKDVNDGVLKIKEYLDENGEKRFNIIGYYASDEQNSSAYPNLGLARASAVKRYMTSRGVSANSINTIGELNEDLVVDENKGVKNSIDFSIIDKNEVSSFKEEQELIKACEALKAAPLVLNFKTSQTSIILTPNQKKKFSRIATCTDKLGAKVKVIGHTDSTGNPANNIVLGLERAAFAKAYLIKNNIANDKIETLSKGAAEPISDNTTAAGRAKNRRTVITIE